MVLLTINSIVGAGVFAMPAGLAIDAGHYSLAVIFVAFVVVAFLALSLAEVSSRFDVTGGPQVYAQHTFGPLAGFTVGWLFTVSRIRVFRTDRADHDRLRGRAVVGAGGTLATGGRAHLVHATLAVFNLRGVTRGALVGNLLTIAKLLPLGLIALAGLWFAGWNNLPVTEPRAPDGLMDALLLALFACVGFDVDGRSRRRNARSAARPACQHHRADLRSPACSTCSSCSRASACSRTPQHPKYR